VVIGHVLQEADVDGAPAFVPERSEIWHADGNGGFSVLRMADGVWPFTGDAVLVPSGDSPGPALTDTLPATGDDRTMPVAIAALLVAAVALTTWRRSRTAT
jgi:LPXTG-motif cell wall-anchored protein